MTATLRWFARQEAGVLLLALGVVLGVWAFVQIADVVREGERQSVDDAVLRLFRRADDPARPVGPGWLVDAAHDVSALGGPAVLTLAVLAVTGYLALLRQWRTVVLLVVAALGGLALSTLLKHLYARPRPAVVPYLAPVVTASFPSGHSMLAAVVYLTLGALLAAVVRQRHARAYVLTVALGLAFLVGVSRVYLGVHYPTDVLAGWSAGLAWAFSCWLVARWLQRRNRIEQSGSGS